MNGAQALVAMLEAYQVKYIFGVPGDTTIPFYDALYDAKDRIQHILARDERSAAYMADAYARVSNKPGVCEGPSGGGATYMLPGVAEAFFSSVPVIAMTTDNAIHYDEKGALTDVDQKSLFRPVTKWNTLVKRANMLPDLVRKAFRTATTGRPGAVHLALPKDVLDSDLTQSDIYAEMPCTEFPAYPAQADPESLKQAADLLSAARRPVMVCGGGAVLSRAWPQVIALAEMLSMPVGTTINGKGAIAEDHPLSIGVTGGNGGRPYANDIIREADLVLYVGTKVNYVDTCDWTAPLRQEPPTIIQMDVDASEIGNNYPVAVGLCGDARLTLHALLGLLSSTHPGDAAALESKGQNIALRSNDWWAQVTAQAESFDVPIRPQRVIAALQRSLDPSAIIVADPGTPTPFLCSQFRVRQAGRHTILNRAHGSLGYAIPAVIGAKVAAPSQTVVGLCGDGSFAMSCGELAAIQQLGLPVVLVQFNNSCYGWIKMLQKLHYHERYFGVDFRPDTDYVSIARGFGLLAERVEAPEDLEPAIQRALASQRPYFLDVLTASEVEETPPVDSWLRAIERSS